MLPAASSTVVVNPLPVVIIDPIGPYCNTTGLTTLTASPNGGTWGGVANSSGQINPSSLGVGNFTVTYSVTTLGCTTIASQSFDINTAPTVVDPNDITVCNNDLTTVNFTGTGGPNYNWTNSNQYSTENL